MRGLAANPAPGSAGLSAGLPHGAHGGPHGASRIAHQPGEPYRSPAKALSATEGMRSAITVVHPITPSPPNDTGSRGASTVQYCCSLSTR